MTLPFVFALDPWSYLAEPARTLVPFVEGPRGLRAFDFRPVRPLPAPCTPSPDGDVGCPCDMSSVEPSLEEMPM